MWRTFTEKAQVNEKVSRKKFFTQAYGSFSKTCGRKVLIKCFFCMQIVIANGYVMNWGNFWKCLN